MDPKHYLTCLQNAKKQCYNGVAYKKSWRIWKIYKEIKKIKEVLKKKIKLYK